MGDVNFGIDRDGRPTSRKASHKFIRDAIAGYGTPVRRGRPISKGERKIILFSVLMFVALIVLVIVAVNLPALPWERPCEQWGWARVGPKNIWVESCIKRAP